MVEEELSVARVGLMSALASGDTGLAYELVLGLMDNGHPFPVILEEVIASIQWESGRRWEVGDYSISEEHASTSAVESLIALLGGSFEQSATDKLVVVVCAEGESHTLPARMATALLAYEGFRTIFLGSSLPANDLRVYLATTAPDALVVSCTRPANLPGARSCIVAGHDASVPVAVGGRAFSDHMDHGDRAAALGADAHAPTLTALPEILENWQPDPAAAEQQVTVRAQTAIPPASTRTPVVTQMIQFLAAGQANPDSPNRVITECAEDLFDTTIAALYLDDDRLLVDHAVWLSQLLDHHAHVPVPAEQLLQWLRRAVADNMPDARTLIDASIATLQTDP